MKGFRWWNTQMKNILQGLGLSSVSTRKFRGFEVTSTYEGPEAVFLDTVQPSEIICVTLCFMEYR